MSRSAELGKGLFTGEERHGAQSPRLTRRGSASSELDYNVEVTFTPSGCAANPEVSPPTISNVQILPLLSTHSAQYCAECWNSATTTTQTSPIYSRVQERRQANTISMSRELNQSEDGVWRGHEGSSEEASNSTGAKGDFPKAAYRMES